MSDTHEPAHTTDDPAARSGGFLDVVGAPGQHDIDTDTADGGGATSASLLGNLAAKRAELAEHLHTDIRVPGWGYDPDEQPRVSIYLRCRPLRPSELETIRNKRRQGGKAKDDWIDLANADTLIRACTEVWAQSGEPVDPAECPEAARLSLRPGDLYGEKTRIDGALADALGMPRQHDGKPKGAVEIVRFLFLHDGNIARAVVQLMDHSNMGAEREEAGFSAG